MASPLCPASSVAVVTDPEIKQCHERRERIRGNFRNRISRAHASYADIANARTTIARSGSSSGIVVLFEQVSRFYAQNISWHAKEAIRAQEIFASGRLSQPAGAALLDELRSKYEAEFELFLKEVNASSTKLLLLYIPSQEKNPALRFQSFFANWPRKTRSNF
jgi:hypothetical protein